MTSEQVVVFGLIETNVENAYNKTTGAFTAPLRGIYVIHVTIGGWNAVDSDPHNILAMFINMQKPAYLRVSRVEQSSKMIVKLLNADVVTIRNFHQVDDSILGYL